MFEVGDSAFIIDVTRIERRGWFKQQQVYLFLSYGLVFYPARDDEELALVQDHVSVSKSQGQLAFDYQEEFVFFLMMVPNKFAFDFRQLDVLSIKRSDNSGAPVLIKLAEFIGEIDLVHSVGSKGFFRLRARLKLVSNPLGETDF